MKKLFSYFIVMVIILGVMLSACSQNIDGKIGSVKVGMSMPEVIKLLGAPYKAKEHPMGVLVFIYKGNKDYHWIFFEQFSGAGHVIKIERQESDSFFPSTDVKVIIKGERIEIQRE